MKVVGQGDIQVGTPHLDVRLLKSTIQQQSLWTGVGGEDWSTGRAVTCLFTAACSKLKPNQTKNLWASSEARNEWALGRGRNPTKPNKIIPKQSKLKPKQEFMGKL